MSSLMRRVCGRVLPPLAVLLLVLGLWRAVVWWFAMPPYLLPTPWQVALAAVEHASQISAATGLTALAATAGFSISVSLGMVVALVFSQSAAIRASCYPYAIFLQTVPIVAIAPLIITWFGYGFSSVVIVAAVISLFPVVTGATTGMLSVDDRLLDLFRLHGAARWQVVWKLRLPNCVPYLLTGSKTSSGLAVVGAIVGEFFVGAGTGTYGLGFLIRQKSEHLKTAELFASVIAATLLGVAIFGIVTLAGETILRRWYRPRGAGS